MNFDPYAPSLTAESISTAPAGYQELLEKAGALRAAHDRSKPRTSEHFHQIVGEEAERFATRALTVMEDTRADFETEGYQLVVGIPPEIFTSMNAERKKLGVAPLAHPVRSSHMPFMAVENRPRSN